MQLKVGLILKDWGILPCLVVIYLQAYKFLAASIMTPLSIIRGKCETASFISSKRELGGVHQRKCFLRWVEAPVHSEGFLLSSHILPWPHPCKDEVQISIPSLVSLPFFKGGLPLRSTYKVPFGLHELHQLSKWLFVHLLLNLHKIPSRGIGK